MSIFARYRELRRKGWKPFAAIDIALDHDWADPMMADLLEKANDTRYSDEWIGNAFRARFSLLGPEHAADPEPAAPSSKKVAP